MKSGNGYKVIGSRPIRHDGVDKVTGRAKYGADLNFPDMLYGKVLRSPHAHAKIISLDVSQALEYPGVKDIITGSDLPIVEERIAEFGEIPENMRFLSDNVLASEKVFYKGQPIAVVAATDIHTAEEAVDLIEVEYEILASVTTVEEAIAPDAVVLHQSLTTNTLGEKTDRPTNIASHFRHENGDLSLGFSQAETNGVVVERTFTTQTVHQGYIEPHTATAKYNPDGELTIWTSTQGAFAVRDQVAEILRHSASKIKVVPLEIGGGFGGKIRVYVSPLAALLSIRTGLPVKITMSREEVFEGTGPAPATLIRVKIGATKDGRITAAEADLFYEAGAYPGSAVGAGANCMFTAYKIPNLRIDGFDVVVNKPRSSAYRAPGAPNGSFAAECVIDEICQKLEIDPLEFRLFNGAKEGDRRPTGPIHGKIGYIETVSAAQTHEHYQSEIDILKRQGRGIASGYWGNGAGRSSVNLTVNGDGTIMLLEGSTDIGGSRASIAMQAAEVLGIASEDVRPAVVDTNTIGETGVTGGSRTTHATGLVAIRAAEDVITQMKGQMADHWEVNQVDFSDGVFSSSNKSCGFKEAAKICAPVVGSITESTGGAGGGFGTHIVDVEVDEETGKVEILRYTAVQDVGTAIHPSYVEGQMQGGVVQGIGWALSEEYVFGENGDMKNSSFLDYRMPTCYDTPMIDTVLVEVPNPGHPFGVRGVGEVPLVPPLAAIANAVSRAIGIRMTDLPMNPGVVLKALDKI
ncbi:oxidoreductase [Candidatus Poribacteria bacterium]|nr:oxidoreductase [Candidatus Poribacteria bacterium]OUT67650.1 MAG: oxidoreductase [bacterium TMED15]